MNKVIMTGKIISVNDAFVAKNGKVCTRCDIETNRLSCAKDIIPVVIPDSVAPRDYLLKVLNTPDNSLTIEGEVRTRNTFKGEKLSLIQYIYVKSVSENEPEDPTSENLVQLSGTIVRKPTYRYTPLGKIIGDIMIAHNPDDKKVSYYIPCIAWGGSAVCLSNLNVGDKINITNGRYQSRIYNKMNVEGQVEERTALEVSINKFEVIKNDEQR